MSKNIKIKKEKILLELKNILFRSPVLKYDKKKEIYTSFEKRSFEDLQIIKDILLKYEKKFFSKVKQSGLNMDVFVEKTNKFYKKLLMDVEEKGKEMELIDIESQLDSL